MAFIVEQRTCVEIGTETYVSYLHSVDVVSVPRSARLRDEAAAHARASGGRGAGGGGDGKAEGRGEGGPSNELVEGGDRMPPRGRGRDRGRERGVGGRSLKGTYMNKAQVGGL